MKLSKNFTLEELTKSYTATRLGIDNSPSQEIIKNLTNLCKYVLQPLRDHFGPLKVNSGYRSVALCEAIGSSDKSYHTLGCAADIESASKTETFIFNYDILEYIHNNLPYDELIAEFFDKEDKSAGWVHVAYCYNENSVPRKMIKLKDKEHNYSRVSLDYIANLYKPER